MVPAGPYTMTSSRFPVSPRLRCKLRYADTFSLGGVTGIQDQQMNLNSLYDPDRSGTGHQPRGFDQLAALYSRYRVYSVKYHVVGTLTTANDALVAGVFPSNSGAAATALADFAEAPMGKFKRYNLYQGFTLTGSVDLPLLNGKTHTAYMADDTTQALTSASPTETLILHVVCVNVNGANSSTQVTVFMEFEAEFSDPVALSSS